MKNEKTIEVLNDLIKINNDRIATYEIAAENIEGGEVLLRTLFLQLAGESREFTRELSERVVAMGATPADASTTPGTTYRAWMATRSTFTGHDKNSIIKSCESGEDAVQRAYKLALSGRDELPHSIVQLIEDQRILLRMSRDLILNHRNDHPEMAKN